MTTDANPQVAMLEPQGPSAKQIAKEVAKLISAIVGIKSIQGGTITLSGGVSSNTATITAVVLAKSVLTLLGSTGSGLADDIAVRLALTNTTTVFTVRTGTTGVTTVRYQVVEYN